MHGTARAPSSSLAGVRLGAFARMHKPPALTRPATLASIFVVSSPRSLVVRVLLYEADITVHVPPRMQGVHGPAYHPLASVHVRWGSM
jgi:hypothetical protein